MRPANVVPNIFEQVHGEDQENARHRFFLPAAADDEVNRTVDADPLGALIYSHPVYPELVEGVFDFWKVGEKADEQERLEQVKRDALARISTDQDRAAVRQRVRPAAAEEVDLFLRRYVGILQEMTQEIETAMSFVAQVAKEFDAAMSEIKGFGAVLGTEATTKVPVTPPRKYNKAKRPTLTAAAGNGEGGGAGVGPAAEKDAMMMEVDPPSTGAGAGAGAGGSKKAAAGGAATPQVALLSCEPLPGVEYNEEEMTAALKLKFQKTLLELQDEFKDKIKKPKLSDRAVTVMMEWWETNYGWPYPDEAEKERLARECGIETQQVQNWLVNRRKRYWIAHFDDRKAPSNREVAKELLFKANVIDKNGRLRK